jgi:hypothetical protein
MRQGSEARMSASLDVRDLRKQFAIGRPAAGWPH